MIRKLIKKWFHLYDIDDLVIGAHCGCCGRWLPNEIVPKINTWSICPIELGCIEKEHSYV